eukprot:5931896-Prymnesium_polylepis.1
MHIFHGAARTAKDVCAHFQLMPVVVAEGRRRQHATSGPKRVGRGRARVLDSTTIDRHCSNLQGCCTRAWRPGPVIQGMADGRCCGRWPMLSPKA